MGGDVVIGVAECVFVYWVGCEEDLVSKAVVV